MALRDQPYIPLYIQDFLTDEKLMECSAESTGVYIKLMCLMHKSEQYGTILLKQKDKQTDNQIKNFALKIARFLPFEIDVIERSLNELISEKVLQLEEDFLSQKRMIRDNNLSVIRSSVGSKGGKKTQENIKDFATNFAKAKSKANYEYENEIEIEYELDNNEKELFDKLPKSKSKLDDFKDKTVEEIFSLYTKDKKDIVLNVALWNSFAKKYSKSEVYKITGERKKKLNSRLNSEDFSMDKILESAKSQSFAMENSWFNFDFIIANETNYIKLLEKKYLSNEPKESNKGNFTI